MPRSGCSAFDRVNPNKKKSRIFWAIFTTSFGFSIYFPSSLMFSIVMFLKSPNQLLITITKSLFFFLLYASYTVFNMPLGLWKLKCFWNNSRFMRLSFILTHSWNFLKSPFVGFLGSSFLSGFLLVYCSSFSDWYW